ncbi:hypothetical protein [Streptomyces sp. NPDC057889]|uniref:hypothetical protein n=1 Tax=unclassified Streptomyces TaxID=2593676 RepID=UPI0036766DAE
MNVAEEEFVHPGKAKLGRALTRLEGRVREIAPDWNRAGVCRTLGIDSSTANAWIAGTNAPRDFAPHFWPFVEHMLNAAYGTPQRPEAKARRRSAKDDWQELHKNAQKRHPLQPKVTPKSPNASAEPGQLIAEAHPIRNLEIHPVIEPRSAILQRLPLLPRYVRRAHDQMLSEEMTAAHEESRLVTLLGDSSTGKTRALWEAIQQLEGWRVWRPTDAHALLHHLMERKPLHRTVLWLNELQRYMRPPNVEVGERVAAELAELLAAPERGPVLAVGTLWHAAYEHLRESPEHQEATTQQGQGAASLFKAYPPIQVSENFDDDALQELRRLAPQDPRLSDALKQGTRRITQYLAGTHELVTLYNNAPPTARAVLDAAADARRLGHSATLPRDFLQAAAASYLDPDLWRSQTDQWRDTWFDQAINYTKQPCRGIPGPLVVEPPDPGEPPYADECFLLADFLTLHLSVDRLTVVPPAGFWEAAAEHLTDPDELMVLQQAARDRWRLRHGEELLERAADAGATAAVREVGLRRWKAGEPEAAQQLLRRAARVGDADALRALVQLHRDAGQNGIAERFRQQASQADSRNDLASHKEFQERMSRERARTARRRSSNEPDPVAEALSLREAGDTDAAKTHLLTAAHVHGPQILHTAGHKMERHGDQQTADWAYQQAVQQGHTQSLFYLARLREDQGDFDEAQQHFWRAVDAGDLTARDTLVSLRTELMAHPHPDRRFWRAVAMGSLLHLMGSNADGKDGADEQPWKDVLHHGLEADGSVTR